MTKVDKSIAERFVAARLYIRWCSTLVLCRLRYILLEENMHLTRLILGFSSLTWALCLFFAQPIFVESRPTYAVMHATMDEYAWGVLFLVSGIVCLISVLFNIRNKYTILFDALLTCMVWTASTLACLAAWWPHTTIGWWSQLLTYSPPVAISGEVWLTLAAWWHFVRQATDRRVSCRKVCMSDTCPYQSLGIDGMGCEFSRHSGTDCQ